MKSKGYRAVIWMLSAGTLLMASIFITPAINSQNAVPVAEHPPENGSQHKPPPNTATRSDYMTADENVKVEKQGGSGDVVVAGATIRIDGPVAGYVMAAGANVNIDADVGNDLWAAGADVVVRARIRDNAKIAGRSVVIEKNGSVGNDAHLAGASVTVAGNINHDLYIGAANAEISSEINGNVVAHVERFMLSPGAVIHGNLTIHSANEPVISPAAQVLGQIDYQQSDRGRGPGHFLGKWLGNWLMSFLWMCVIGLVFTWFSSVWANRVSDVLNTQTGKAFLTGLIATFAAPLAIILLSVTVIGLPLAMILGSVSLIGVLLSGGLISYHAGDWILRTQVKKWEDSNVAKVLTGALVVSFVMLLPFVGPFAKLTVVFFGIGALIIERRDLFRKMQEQGLA